MKRTLSLSIFLSLTLGLCVALVAGTPRALAKDVPPPVNTDKRGLALEGYDPVAYFEAGGGKPTKGKQSITADHGGATYRFAKETHRDLFLADPESYLPDFGGWCAYAMAEGKKVEVDPKRFEVHEGRLFLFYRDWFTDTLKPWQKDRDVLLPRADAAWVKIVDEEQE